MRTQIAKTGYLPAEYIPHTFWLVHPSPFSAGSSWGLLSRKIFFDFYFSDFHSYLSEVWIEIIFLNFTLVILISKFFLFFQNIASTRQVFTRYSLSAFIFSRFILVWLRFGVYFISLRIMASIWFSITILTSLLIYDSFLLASSYVDSMLYLLNSLSLWLFCLL